LSLNDLPRENRGTAGRIGEVGLAFVPWDAKERLFAWCIASCLKPQLAIDDRADPVIECIVRRLEIPFADYWRPTAANYWGA